MNFLDLSTASEEERRLITELLSDTSVVNFAEPIRPLDLPKSELHQQQSSGHLSRSNVPHHNSQHPQHKSQPTKPKQQPQHNYQQNSRYQQNFVDTNEESLNHVQSGNLLRSQDSQYQQHQVPGSSGLTAKASSNTPQPSTPYNSHSSAHNTTNTSTNNTSNSIDSNNVNAHLNSRNPYPINDSTNINGTIKNYNYPIVSQDDMAAAVSSQAAKISTTTHSSLANNATFTTTTNVTQSTSTVPPQTLANQMTPMMAGDINSVIGMDMASAQPPSYPMPTPPHVTAYGPAPPPPPHHVYGGPPIFQPYATHYIFPYNLPYPMPYVLPPTNSVVPARPQSSQPTNAMMSNNSRAHMHHPRSKLKEMPKQQQHQHQHQNHQNQQQSFHHQQAYRVISNSEPHVDLSNNASEQPGVEYNDYISKDQPSGVQRTEVNLEDPKSTSNLDEQDTNLDLDQPAQHEQARNKDGCADNVPVRTEEETIKVSSDEGFDTQSSLDLSKQSQESTSAGDRSRPKSDTVSEKLGEAALLSVTDEKSEPSQEARSTGPWGSASSKSWASLFRADGNAYHTAPIDGEIENDVTRVEPSSDRNIKVSLQNFYKQEVNGMSSSNVTSTKEQRSQDAARRAQDKLAPKLAQKISSISLKHSLPLLRPRGFINKGNGCYINSTLQALIACPPFYNLMKEIGELRGLKRDGSCTPILDSFAELFQNFPPLDGSKKSKQVVPTEQKLPVNNLQADAIEPRCIYNVLGQIKSECLRGAQEDAEEFLSSVLNGLHEEMIGLSETMQSLHGHTIHQNGRSSDTEDNGDDINNDENLWREVGPKNRSLPIRAATVINTPIQEIFGGSLFSIRTAGKDRCGHRSPFFDLQLDISGDNVKSLQDAIKSFTATEIIQDFYCSKTKQKLDAQRRTSLDQLPPILILHLKQFFYTQDHGLKKLTKRIEYPIDFELPESCLHDKNSDKSLKNSRSYKLLAVVYHEGKEAVKGHYLTDVYHIGSSQWIRCDDSNLKVVPVPRIENSESSRTPYLLFYRRLNTLGPRQSSNHDNRKRS